MLTASTLSNAAWMIPLGGTILCLVAAAVRGIVTAIGKGRAKVPSAGEQAKDCDLHDPLTGLLNREGLKRDLGLRTARGESFAFLYMDLDRFMAANELLGTSGADQLLKAIAERLLNACDEGASIARLEADQFVLLAPARDLGVAAKLGNRIVGLIGNRPYQIRDELVPMTASAGLALHPYHGEALGPLMGEAEAALFQAKCAGGGKCVVVRSNPMRPSQAGRQSGSGVQAVQNGITRGAA